MVHAARRALDEAFLGLDADASRMREAAHRAARAVAKRGLPNAWFAVAAAEALPPELHGRVDALRVTLPWGSLLRGAVDAEPWFMEAITRVLRPDGELRLMVSVAQRDGIAGVSTFDAAALEVLACRYAAAGYRVRDARPAATADVVASRSSWAKRLGIPERRPAFVMSVQVGPSKALPGEDEVPK